MGYHEKGATMDVVIIAAAQRVEHYEIAAYGTMATLAKAAGHQDLARLLGQTLDEEKRTDADLTRVAESEVNPAWVEECRSAGATSANENRGGGQRRTS